MVELPFEGYPNESVDPNGLRFVWVHFRFGSNFEAKVSRANNMVQNDWTSEESSQI